MEAEKKLGQGSAFPCNMELPDRYGGGKYLEFIPGITKRYYTACIVMQGILASYAGMSITTFPKEWIATESFKIADELLKQEDENK